MKDARETSFFSDADSSLEMVKNHSKKQLITDIAIEKVPFIRYPEIPCCAYQTIQDFSKETLRIAKEKNSSNKVSLVFSLWDIIDKVTPTFGVSFGGEHDVNPEDSVEAYHLLHQEHECVLVLTHNHPATYLNSQWIQMLYLSSLIP